HGRDLVLERQPHALDVDVHDPIVGVFGLIGQRSQHLLDTGVVEGTIEPAEGRQRAFDHRFDVALLRDVGTDEDRLAAGGLDPRAAFLALSLTASADDDLRALLGELDCGGAADPGVPTSDEYDSAYNLTHETLHARTGEQGRCQGTPTRIICRGRCAMPRRRVSD